MDLASAEQSKHLAVSGYAVREPSGIRPVAACGREFSRFEDLQTIATTCVQAHGLPRRRLGQGKVELVEIATNDETSDNIVAYWTRINCRNRVEDELQYTLTFSRDEDKLHAAG